MSDAGGYGHGTGSGRVSGADVSAARSARSAPAPLAAAHLRAAARVLADAFIDDPGWVAAGPVRRRSRWKYTYRTCLGALRACDRWGQPSWGVFEEGEPVAILAGYAPGRWPPPQLRSLALMAPGPLLAGPAPLARGLRSAGAMERAHPRYPHFYVAMFAVSPRRQRAGLGRALMGEALAAADEQAVPAYLETGNPDNLPYYGSHGYEIVREVTGARNTPIWLMERPARADTG